VTVGLFLDFLFGPVDILSTMSDAAAAAAAAGGSSALLQYTLGCLQDMRCFGHNIADSQPSAGVTSVHLSM
jgi:hypothetical protein